MQRDPGSRRGRDRARGQRRPPTWEISDLDTEEAGGAGAAGAGARASAEGRGAAAEALRPEQALPRLAMPEDPAFLEDAGADVLMEALWALGCELCIEPQRPARSLQWSRARPGPCPRGVPPEVWASDEEELLLLLEPEEFLQGVSQLTQQTGHGLVTEGPSATALTNKQAVCSRLHISGPTCSVPWTSPKSPALLHLAVIRLDAYLWSHPLIARGMQKPENPEVAHAEVAVGWPEVEEALVLLQLWADLDVLLVDSWQELSQHVCAFTKAFTQRPFRCDPPVPGRRLRPVGQDCLQAFAACSTEQECLGLLADLPVKAGEGMWPHRVGPDLSCCICLFLTTANPDLLLDLGS